MQNYILNTDGKPYGDQNLALNDAKALENQLGIRFLVLPHQDGYALVAPKTNGQDTPPTSNPVTEAQVNLFEPGSPLALSVDNLNGPESDPDFNGMHGLGDPVNARHTSMPEIESPTKRVEIKPLEVQEESVPEKTIEESQKETKALHLSPSSGYFYREILGMACLLALYLWGIFFGDPNDSLIMAINENAESRNLFGKVIFYSVAIISCRCIFIYSTYSFSFEDDIVKTRIGIIARNASSVKVTNIQTIGLDQNVIERLLNFGTLKFFSSGSSAEDVVFTGIRNPAKIRAYIESYI